ncbi:MAG: ACT domain-containing protein [Candidatus Woesearchaeota archaeon]|nr:ACT domain-containing protein [Candidatus Woesearchaeota archaeon]
MKILITDGLDEEGKNIFAEKGYEITDRKIKAEDLPELVKGYDALVVRSATKATREVIESADQLKIIGRSGVGVDNIDLEAALERGIVVKNAPDGNTNAAAELTVGLMLAIARSMPQAYHALNRGTWKKKQFDGIELLGKTLGIIGYGRIGSTVAERLSGFRMNVLVYDPFRQQETGVNYTDLDTLLKQSDFVTLHTPKLKGTIDGKIGKEQLEMMKKTAYLINASRGGNVKEADLYQALQTGRIAGAAFDVFEEEGKEGQPYSNRLFELPNFVGIPHLGASTREAQLRTSIQIAENIVRYLDLGDMAYAVNINGAVDCAWKKETSNLYIGHENQPGMIAAITGVLGRHGINLESVPAATADGRAITIIRAYSVIPDNAITEIRAIPGVYRIVK